MEIPRHWRLKAQRYRLEGSICPTCGKLTFPPRPLCPDCTARVEQITRCELSLLLTAKHIVDAISSKGR